MELKVKQKIVNGKKVMGIIDENLNEIAPFEFKNIIEVKSERYKNSYFICEKEDGTCSLYDYDGYCRISYNDGYKDLKLLRYSLDFNCAEVVAKKDDEVGILSARVNFKYDNGNHEFIGTEVKVKYEFGKCDVIKELEDGTVQLIKHTKGEDRIGYWYHQRIDEVVEPKFLSYDYYTIKCENGVGLYRYQDENGDKRTGAYRSSDYIEDDKLTFNVEMIKYSKIKAKKKVIGLMQKVLDSSKSGSRSSFKFAEFLPDDYSNISYDEENQIFFLEQSKNGQVKKGFIGVAFDWHLGGQGWRTCGYPNLKIVVNVPCEYDDLVIIENNYAVVKKDRKYGLIKFSFGRSNGDWDMFNRKRVAYGRCYEIVPCMYDSIEKVKDNFIGRVNNEERIITDCIDDETKEFAVVSNNYKKVKPIFDEVFICDLEDGKKEVVVIKKYEKFYLSRDASCTVSKVSPCDDAKIISNNGHGYLIKVINGDITDVYCINDENNLEKIEENINDISCDFESKFYIITKNDGHIKFTGNSGRVIFSTEKLGIEPNDLSVTYLKAIGKFRVTNDNLTKIYSSLDKNDDNETYKDRVFSCFDALQTYYYTFVGYTEILENGLVTKLSHVNTRNELKETEILRGNFQVENIVLNGKRIIFSAIDSETGQKKYGVIESQEGKTCIDCDFNNIKYDSENQVFICSTNDEEIIFDIDGFVIEEKNIINRNCKQQILKLTIQNDVDSNTKKSYSN